MDREEFNGFVARLEKVALRHPKRFRWTVGLLAALGFGYLLTVFAVTSGLTLAIFGLALAKPNAATIKIAIFFGIACGGLSWAILRGLFVRIPRPEGRVLTRAEVPELFDVIRDLRKQLGAPAFHEVLLTGDHNAGVVQTPRLGVFGWHRNSLLLGLPLLQGVSVEEFRAILAHEFAHLSGSDGKFGSWIYRLRRVWERVFEELHKRERGSRVLGKFLDWFWPRFNARAFVLSRVQEYKADATAAKATSAEALRHGLVRTQVQGRWLDERFWPEFFQRVREVDAPPARLYQEMGAGLVGLHGHPEAGRWISQAFNFQTNCLDTHPSLKDRIGALLQVDPTLDETAPLAGLEPGTDAATRLLGDKAPMLAEEFSQKWATMMEPGWRERHQETHRLSEELAKFEETGSQGVAELWARIQIIINRDSDEQARPLLEELLTLEPEHGPANFVLGRRLLELDEPRGVALIERAMAKDTDFVEGGLNLLHGYYSRTGQREELPKLDQRYDAHAELMAKAAAERSTATNRDHFLPHELTGETLEKLEALFSRYPEIATVHIARKQVIHLPEKPMYVVGVKVKVAWWKLRLSSSNAKLVDALVEELPLVGNYLVFLDESNLVGLGRSIRNIPNSQVYRREKK